MPKSRKSRKSHKSHKSHKRSHMRKSHKSRKSHKTHSRRRYSRRRGGMAPVGHSDIGWSSKYSLGQGVDFRDYHAGQYGGAALQGAALSSMGDALPSALRASAHLAGQDRALADIRGLSDQSGGRRKSKRNKRNKRRRGGMAPFPAPGMLLGSMDYSKAGLNPHWRDVEVDAAQARAAL